MTIAIPGARDGLVISNDGKVMLARGYSGISVFNMLPITPITGALGGSVAHSYTKVTDLTAINSSNGEDGRDGMAISRVDSRRAVVVGTGPTSGSPEIALVTGLTSTPVITATLTFTGVYSVYSVDITYDGKYAIVGTDQGLFMVSGVDTGTLALVGTLYQPTYTVSGTSYKLGEVPTLGLTLDGKYVVVCAANGYNYSGGTLLVIPISATGFGAPVGQLNGIAVPNNDQMVMH
jgi:hypothetical protein